MEQQNNYQENMGQQAAGMPQQNVPQQPPQYQQMPPMQEQKSGKGGLFIAILVILILLTGGFFWLVKSGFINFGAQQNDLAMYNGRWVGSSTVTVPGDGTCVSANAMFDIVNGTMTGTVSSEEYNVTTGAAGQVSADGKIVAGFVNDTTKTYGSEWEGQITGDVATGTWMVPENGCSGTWRLQKTETTPVSQQEPQAAPVQAQQAVPTPAPTPVAQTPSVAIYNGRWVGSSTVTVPGDGTCVATTANFTLAGGVMSGTVTSPEYGVTVDAAGTVDAYGNIEAGLVESTDTTSGSYWKGKITGSTATGTWESVVNGCSGTWQLIRQ